MIEEKSAAIDEEIDRQMEIQNERRKAGLPTSPVDIAGAASALAKEVELQGTLDGVLKLSVLEGVEGTGDSGGEVDELRASLSR